MPNDAICEIWPKAILFDLDGTLTDAAPDITASLNEVLEKRGRAAPDNVYVRKFEQRGSSGV